MKVDVLLGLQWGDEGKGKIVDVLTPKYDFIARFQGGPNAGHTLQFNNIKHVLHTIPSGIFHSEKINIIGNGVVIDPVIFKNEIESLEIVAQQNTSIKTGKLLISKKAHLILPTHRILDAASEAAKGKTKIGSTLKGIGPAYMDKTGRNGLRVGDINTPQFREKYKALTQKHEKMLHNAKFEYDLSEYEEAWFAGIEVLKKYNHIDSEYEINEALNKNQKILAEGAQGTLLDIEFGSYPYVTSSNTICSGACSGLGVAPSKIDNVFGIFKAYCTRVGSGPFPTELFDETGEKLQKAGHEFGATTGRARRCGWLDLVALKYSIILNGVTHLIMTKVDVLNKFEEIKVATSYKVKQYKENGEIEIIETDRFPYNIEEGIVEPVYTKFKGWNTEISQITTKDDFPKELKNYIKFIEDKLEVPISIVSIGPKRTSTIKIES